MRKMTRNKKGDLLESERMKSGNNAIISLMGGSYIIRKSRLIKGTRVEKKAMYVRICIYINRAERVLVVFPFNRDRRRRRPRR